MCLFVCVSTRTTRKPCSPRTFHQIFCMLPVAMAHSNSDGVAIRYVLPVIWMTVLRLHSAINIEFLLTSSDHKLFRNMQKCEHCLNHLLPPCKDNFIALRLTGHEFILRICNYQLHIGVRLLYVVFLTF